MDVDRIHFFFLQHGNFSNGWSYTAEKLEPSFWPELKCWTFFSAQCLINSRARLHKTFTFTTRGVLVADPKRDVQGGKILNFLRKKKENDYSTAKTWNSPIDLLPGFDTVSTAYPSSLAQYLEMVYSTRVVPGAVTYKINTVLPTSKNARLTRGESFSY